MVILFLLLKFNMFQIYGFNNMCATITWGSLVKMLITCPLSRTINLEILGVNPRTHYLLLTMILRNSEILQNLRTVNTIIKFYLFFFRLLGIMCNYFANIFTCKYTYFRYLN